MCYMQNDSLTELLYYSLFKLRNSNKKYAMVALSSDDLLHILELLNKEEQEQIRKVLQRL